MSDNLGNNQLNVLDPDYRNWEEVIYQKKKPPLSSEMNLNGRVMARRGRELVSDIMPSGWAITGDIKSGWAANDCPVGTILTSSSFSANTFKLVALNRGTAEQNLIAWVSGMRVLVQGTNSTDENNIIILPEPPTVGYRVDFVFLEVWRKLIRPEDVVYKYGNVLYGGTNPDNDLIDSFIGVETNIRVQMQYRIRVAEIDIENYPSGFDPNNVFAQGPLSAPVSCTTGNFNQVAGDPGLWRAGLGDSASQDLFGTVDGYVYAVPICAVRRRNTEAYEPNFKSNGSARSLQDYLDGWASDRPDNLYNDWIDGDDILDMRHRVEPQVNHAEVCADGFSKLITGQLRGRMVKGTLGEDHFGAVLLQADAVSNVDKDGSDKIVTGDGIRRIFSNAGMLQPEAIQVFTVNDKVVGTPGGVWAIGDRVEIDVSTIAYPTGTLIQSIEERFTHKESYSNAQITAGSVPASIVQFEVQASAGASLLGKTYPIRIEYTIQYPSGPYGLYYLPDSFLEFRKEDSTASIATRDADIRVRNTAAVVTTDGTMFNMLHNAGGRITEQYDFGHQMVYHVQGNGTETVVVPRQVDGHDIIGVVSAKTGGSYRTFSVNRTAAQYNVGLGSPAVPLNDDVELVLYTGAKYFEGSKQGRGIVDSFEMAELVPNEPADGAKTQFTIDSTNQTILALASTNIANGAGFAYVDGVRRTLQTNNSILPLDSTKTRIQVEFSLSDTPDPGALIEVPILKRSAVAASEGYTFFYQRTPYQGLLDSTTTGRVEAVGPALVTTAGSGGITDVSYSEGSASFTAGDSTVQGTGTEWLSYAHSGDIISADSLPDKGYKIETLIDNGTLTVSSPAEDTVSGAYTITTEDQPSSGRHNIIDRLATFDKQNDASGMNDGISTAVTDLNSVINTKIVSNVQDIADSSVNSAIIGENTADRGRSTINLYGPLGRGNLGLRFERLDTSGHYQKTFQPYILNENNDGRLYLMVVGSETDNDSTSNFFNQASNLDTVDIFELPGKPVTKRRIG